MHARIAASERGSPQVSRSIVLVGLKYASVVVVGAAALTAAACGSGSPAPRAHRPARLGGGPYWVAGGELIAFIDGTALRVMRSDGSHRRTVGASYGGSVSPSGRRVAEIPESRPHLVLRTLAGKRLGSFRLPSVRYEAPVWAPAEQAVALPADDGSIAIADTRTGVRVIHANEYYYPWAPSVAWSPDGHRIAFLSERPHGRVDLMLMRRDGMHLVTVARGVRSPGVWSPDGQQLAFSREGARGIYVVRPDGSGLRRVAPGWARQIAWSPDGQRLAFLGLGISVVSVRGGRPRQITRTKGAPGATQDGLSWAPGKRVLWSRESIIWTGLPGSPPVPIG
jgi:WD40 repeat protein